MRKKRSIYAIITLLILVIGIFAISAVVVKTKAWHDSDHILITVNGFNMTLQEAIDYNVFVDGATQSYTTEIPNPGHSADEIWVSVDDNETTLQDALSTIGLCGISSPSSSYISSTDLGQFANEIEISSGTSLQDAIDSGELVSVDGDWTGWSGWSHPNAYDDGAGGTCSVECGGGTQNRTRTCANPEPYCAGADCIGDSSESQSCNTQSCITWTWQPFTYWSCYPAMCNGAAVPCDWSIEGQPCSFGDRYVCEGGLNYCGGTFPGCSLYQSVCG